MARNRRSQSSAIRFGPALKAFVLCLLIGGSGVGYVWEKEQIARLGQQITIRETRLRTLAYQNEQLHKRLAKLRSPKFLEIRGKDLGLALPQPDQIMRLTEPPAEPARSDHEPQYAARNDRSMFGP